MNATASIKRVWVRVKPFTYAILALTLFLVMMRWSGFPTQNRGLFVLGAGVLVLMLGSIFLVGFYLLTSPLSKGQQVARAPVESAHRRALAVVLAASSICIVVGGFWDEVWHRQYGLPFGKDLLWRPHLLIYTGLLSVSLCALLGLFSLWRNGHGTLRQRFRADPTVGLLVLLGAFLLYVVPADPIWHLIYGEDVTAWSLPHLLLMLNFVCVMLVALAMYLSATPARRLRGPLSFSAQDLLPLFALAFALMVALQLLTTEWDGVRTLQEGNQHPFWRRPEWLLPALVAALAGFFGTLANHATRRVGTATLVGALSLGCRYELVRTFGYEALSADAWLLILPPTVALDLLYGYRLRRSSSFPSWVESGLAAAVGLALSLPLMDLLFVYPRVNAQTVPPMLLASLLAALGACYVGAGVGGFLSSLRSTEPDRAPRLGWLAPTALLATVGGIALFIVSARPPV